MNANNAHVSGIEKQPTVRHDGGSPRRRSLVFAKLVLLVTTSVVAAQEIPEFSPGRPGETESTTLVPRGYFHIELGSTWARDRGPGDNGDDSISPLFRFGLTNGVELRLGLDGFKPRQGNSSSHLETVHLGSLIHVRYEDGWKPEISFLVAASIPTEGSDEIEPTARLAAAHSLPGAFSFGSHLGLTRTTDSLGEHVAIFDWSTALGLDLSPRWSTYVELYGGFSQDRCEDCGLTNQVGVAFLLAPTLLLDLAVETALENGHDSALTLGVSFRLPG